MPIPPLSSSPKRGKIFGRGLWQGQAIVAERSRSTRPDAQEYEPHHALSRPAHELEIVLTLKTSQHCHEYRLCKPKCLLLNLGRTQTIIG